jgi:hypothetical protein
VTSCSFLTSILSVFSDNTYKSTSQSVRVFVALAPVIFLGHMSVPVLIDLTKLPSELYETVLGKVSSVSLPPSLSLVLSLSLSLPRSLYSLPFSHRVSGHKSFLASASDLDKLLPILCTYTPTQCEDVLCYLAGCENARNINDV